MSKIVDVIRKPRLFFLLLIQKLRPFVQSRQVHVLNLFDTSWYLEKNTDVAESRSNALNHYRDHGWREGRWPNPIFDPLWYTDNNPDVAQSGIEPLAHFERHGRFEGRRPSAVFDPGLYSRLHPDVATSDTEPCEHFIRYGRFEGRATVETGESHVELSNSRPASTEGSLQLSIAIAAMRYATAIADRPFPEEAIVEAVQVLTRLDEGQSDWRSRFLAKTIYRVDEGQRPVPDGLSYAYLELADKLNDGGLASGNLTFDERIVLAGVDPVGAAEALMQRELGEAVKLQAKLLHLVGSQL